MARGHAVGSKNNQQANPPRRLPGAEIPGTLMVDAVQRYLEANEWALADDHAILVAALTAAAKTCDAYPDLASGISNLRLCEAQLHGRKPAEVEVKSVDRLSAILAAV